jgi:hypothetical protein
MSVLLLGYLNSILSPCLNTIVLYRRAPVILRKKWELFPVFLGGEREVFIFSRPVTKTVMWIILSSKAPFTSS